MRVLMLSLAAGCLLVASGVRAEDAPAVKPYPFEICLVSDEPIGDAPHTIVQDGQEVKFCCKGCLRKFEKNPQKYLDIIASGKLPEVSAKPEGSQKKPEGSHKKPEGSHKKSAAAE